MIKHTKHTYKTKSSEKLDKKYITITITNVCNLHCGGCNQLCGLFEKENLWFENIKKIKKYIENIRLYEKPKQKKIGIFGGEPTLHPQWEEILNLLYDFPDLKFIVYTNGRINVAEKYNAKQSKKVKEIYEIKNVKFNVSPKCGKNKDSSKIEHLPQLIAPIDVEKNHSKNYFWKKAQKQCVMWNICGKTIYNNKAYFCESAAAMDHLEGGKRGWDIEEGKNPFEKSNEEIAKQAKEFCFRCGNLWSGNRNIPGMNSSEKLPKGVEIQKIEDPYFVSATNIKLIKESKKNIIELKVIN